MYIAAYDDAMRQASSMTGFSNNVEVEAEEERQKRTMAVANGRLVTAACVAAIVQ